MSACSTSAQRMQEWSFPGTHHVGVSSLRVHMLRPALAKPSLSLVVLAPTTFLLEALKGTFLDTSSPGVCGFNSVTSLGAICRE